MKQKHIATFYALLAAALYAINVPFSKLLLEQVSPTMMASFLYFGAGLGLFLYGLVLKATGKNEEKERLTRKELPYTTAMVLLDIAAPILLMFGIRLSNASNVSLINNFEIVATSLIALLIFKEYISKKLWTAISLVIVASVLLSFEGKSAFEFNYGSLFVLGACLCWGFENNCTKMISHKSSVEIVIIKGFFSGLGSLIVAFIAGESFPEIKWLCCVLLLGFVSYGLSIHYYISAQKELGAAKTSAFYSIAPFLGVAFGMAMLGEKPNLNFYIGLLIMAVAAIFMVKDTFDSEKNS